jgi:hypothetical protein
MTVVPGNGITDPVSVTVTALRAKVVGAATVVVNALPG